MADASRKPAAYAIGIGVPRAARHDLRALAMLFYVVAGASLVLLAIGPITTMLVGVLAGPEPSDLSFEICARLAVALSVVALALAGLPFAGTRAPLAAGSLPVAAAAFAAGAGALTLALAAAWAGGVAVVQPRAGDGGAGLFALGGALILLGVVAEELLLRGLLQPVLVRAWGAVPGVLVCALGFAVIHMVGGWGHPVSLLNILLAGVWFGLLALRGGGLAAPVLAHFGYNWAEEMLFGASPNPGTGAFGSVIDVDLGGAAIWGGSVEGLNASLVASVVLAALIAPLALSLRARAGRPA